MRRVPLLAVVFLLAGCGGGAARTPRPPAQARRPLPVRRVAGPNIVFVLTDDLSDDLLRFLPSVRELQREGTSFSHYIVSDSLCCPSRASIFTGMYPHDTGVYANSGPGGGVGAFRRKGDAMKTLARPLLMRGYRTALMGKYLNGYSARDATVAPWWTNWTATGKAYHGFNYGLSVNGTPVQLGNQPQDYFTDVISG